MLQLATRELRVDLLDPNDVTDAALQGVRYCQGGYIWQVHDARLGLLVSGPEHPRPDPQPFNGQGLPESFRHRTRDRAPLTWAGDIGLGIGTGILAAEPNGDPRMVEPCRWTLTTSSDHIRFETSQAAAGFSYRLQRTVELRGRTLTSFTELTNTGEAPLALQWFAHPFWALTHGRARVRLPAGTTVAENPGFAVANDGLLTFKRPFVTPADDQFALLALPRDRELTLALDHPALAGITFATSFVPDECPVWANAHTVSVEPYLHLRLAPGDTRRWHVRHGFGC